MSSVSKKCPYCGNPIEKYLHPYPTVDIIIEMENGGIILIKRKNPPISWALPGGFVDYGESLEHAAVREAKEETSLEITLKSQFHTYSDPQRDFSGNYFKISIPYLFRSSKGCKKAHYYNCLHCSSHGKPNCL